MMKTIQSSKHQYCIAISIWLIIREEFADYMSTTYLQQESSQILSVLSQSYPSH